MAAQQDLIQRTALRYFDVLAAQDTVDAAQATLEAFSRQLEQADKRFEVGLIAITDVQEARAAHDQAAAGVIQAKRTLATAQEFLRELTGESVRFALRAGRRYAAQVARADRREQWVTTALDQNLRVISARLATDIAKEDVRIARSGHLPTLDIVASRSDQDFSGTQISRDSAGDGRESPADQSQLNDSIGVQVTVPIYSGGATSSRVRQRVYLHRAARERLERANRETERAARDAYLGVISEISRVQSAAPGARIEPHGAAGDGSRLRSRHAYDRRRARRAPPAVRGADELLAQPLRLHPQRAAAAARDGNAGQGRSR